MDAIAYRLAGVTVAYGDRRVLDIATLEIPIEGRTLRITASVGVASAIPASQTSAATLVADADKALYEAKHHGRNCVRAAAPRITT